MLTLDTTCRGWQSTLSGGESGARCQTNSMQIGQTTTDGEGGRDSG